MKLTKAVKLEIEWRAISVTLSIVTTYILTRSIGQALNIVGWLTIIGITVHLFWLKIRV